MNGNEEEDLPGRIRSILAEKLFMDASPEAVADDDSLTGKHGVDSVRLFDLVVGLESEFSIAFDDSELALAHFDTVAGIAARVKAKLDSG